MIVYFLVMNSERCIWWQESSLDTTQQENDIEDDGIAAQTLVAVYTSTDNNHTFKTHTNEIKQVL